MLHLFNLLAPEEGDSELCKSIKIKIVDYLNSKYEDPSTSDLLNIASFVDPRFRAKYIPSEKMDTLKQEVVMEAESLLSDQGRSCELPEPDPAVPEPADQGEAAVAVPPTTKKKKSLASFFKHDTVTNTTHTKRERIENAY